MKLLKNNQMLYLLPNNETEITRGIPIELIPQSLYEIEVDKVLELARENIQQKAVMTNSFLNDNMIKSVIISYFTEEINKKFEQGE